MAMVEGEDRQRVKEHEVPPEPVRLPRRRWAVLGVLGAASFFDGLDANIIAVALPSIQRELGGGFSMAQWAVAGYSLATAVLLVPVPLVAKLSAAWSSSVTTPISNSFVSLFSSSLICSSPSCNRSPLGILKLRQSSDRTPINSCSF